MDFEYRDPINNSYLYLWINNAPGPDTYYPIGWAGDDWQDIFDKPDNRWYIAQWSYGNAPGETWWSEWTYHASETQQLEALWNSPTPTLTPGITPTPSASPTPSTTPTPSFAYWYLPAGGTRINGFDFDQFVSINNPTTDDAYVEITAVDKLGPIVRINDTVSPESRYTLDLDDMVAGTRGENNDSVSLLIYDLTDRIIMVDRSMYWDAGGFKWGGGHNTIGSHTRAVRWALPEGATHMFDEFIHIVNPDAYYPADIRVTFMNQTGQNWIVQTDIPPESNWKIYVNDIVGSQPHCSTLVESLPTSTYSTANDGKWSYEEWEPDGKVPVAADRTMYWDNPGYNNVWTEWIGGHASRGTTEKSTTWYLSEGATHMFDMFVLVQNPDPVQDADIRITLMGLDGVLATVEEVVTPLTRYTCYVNRVVGFDQPHVSAIVESLPRPAPAPSPHDATFIMCERAMYWKPFLDQDNYYWGAAHDTIGALYGAPVWYLPEGATVGFDEYILLANPDKTRTAEAEVTFYFETGTPQWTTVTIAPQSRQTIYVNKILRSPAIASRIEETSEPFSAKIPIIAERAMYWHSYSPWVEWIAGHNTIGIPVRTEGK